MGTSRLLEVKDLRTSFLTHVGEVKAIRGLCLGLDKGEAVGIVGESGSGKSVTSLSIMGLLPYPGKVVGGEIRFKDKDLLTLSKTEMNRIRGNEIAMIFQDPMISLNPVFTIGNQIVEAIRQHTPLSKAEAKSRAVAMLKLVGIPSPEKRVRNYPHEFSGGMRQRAMIAMALSCEPELLIADEPTTALDVTIQSQILELLRELKAKVNTSIILITHDLGIVAELCSRAIVMYGGQIMEAGLIEEIFYDPKHPYTWGLLKSIPRLDLLGKKRLVPIKGSPPDLLNPPRGCPFCPRCPHAMKICLEREPEHYNLGKTHSAACWLLDQKAPPVKADTGVRERRLP